MGLEILIAGIPKGPMDVVGILRTLMMGKDAIYGRFAKIIKKKFDKAIKNAKITGQSLAIALVVGCPFTFQTISFVRLIYLLIAFQQFIFTH